MAHHITADRLVESATQAVTEELFRDFDNTLRTLCDEEDDRKAVFRTLRYARIRLHVLCGYISKEDTPESDTQIRFLHIVIGYIDMDICLARDKTYRRWRDSHERIGRILRRVVRYSPRCAKSLRRLYGHQTSQGREPHLFSRQVARTPEPADTTRR